MRHTIFAITTTLALGASPAASQGVDTVPAPGPAAIDLPSPGKATLISVGATVGALGLGWLTGADGLENDFASGLAAAGLLLGPAAGYVYGGRTGRGLAGVGVRVGGAALMGAGASACEINIFGESEDGGCVLVLAGAGIVLASVIYDLAVVDNRVRENNERTTARVGVAPYVGPRGGVGAVLTVRH